MTIINTEDNKPKKRGRKPKVKIIELDNNCSDNIINIDIPVKILKKRGRKPKPKTEEELNKIKIPKKRGRKPKNNDKEYFSNQILTEPMVTKNLLLSLPVKLSDILEKNNSIPEPFDNDNEFKPLNNSNDDDQNSVGGYAKFDDNNIMTLEDIKNDRKCIFNNISKNSFNNDNINIDLTSHLKDFAEFKKDMKIPNKTNIACFWDTCTFNNQPVCIPKKFENGIFYVYGCFCSFECAAAHIFKKNYDSKWEEFSLLHLLYKYSNGRFKKINLASSPEVLDKFGGPIDINEFRYSSKSDQTYKVLEYPMISLIPKVEKILNENTSISNILPINFDKIKNNNSDYVLKRDKPVTGKNTLENFMDLKIL